ncbi:hypothetical protein DPMN_099550 [Dreissena polymorpha]|uniref:Uncharacterized protein n=1 Tax=Dreissena polymorpha TaxID=45954 RepID=A0A9D4LFN9_DREPO|nr:hypothetical protein DPMN_099550 [Dreissena polymorpha]
MSYPGHCRLLLERHGTTTHWDVTDSLCDDGYGINPLSSALYVQSWSNIPMAEGIVQHDRSGPSVPTALIGDSHFDTVHAFRYYCPSILSKTAIRPRHWPQPEVVQHIVSLGVFLLDLNEVNINMLNGDFALTPRR